MFFSVLYTGVAKQQKLNKPLYGIHNVMPRASFLQNARAVNWGDYKRGSCQLCPEEETLQLWQLDFSPLVL